MSLTPQEITLGIREEVVEALEAVAKKYHLYIAIKKDIAVVDLPEVKT